MADAKTAAPTGRDKKVTRRKPDTKPARAETDALGKLAHKRLGDFAALFAQAMIADDPKTVHDLRVASRRLQQLLRALHSVKNKKPAKKAGDFLRALRQALGPLRNLDVMAEMAAARAQAGHSAATRGTWLGIASAIEKERAEENARAREAMKDFDLTGFLDRMTRTLHSRSAQDSDAKDLQETTERRFQSWSDALSQVVTEPTVKRLHALRIAGKRLRYSIELRAAVSDGTLKPLAQSLAKLQDNLGAWHDVHTLMQYVDAYLNQKELRAERAGESRALLSEVEREQKRGQTQADEAIAAAQSLRNSWPIKSDPAA